MNDNNKLKSFALSIFNPWKRTCKILFKILIPISILIKILQETGGINYVSNFFDPLMQLMGLPGEMGIVWASAIFGNLYGGLLAFYSLQSTVSLTVAQATILMTALLIAHSFLMEVVVVYKAGLKWIPIVLFRLGMAVVVGMFLNFFYTATGLLQEPASQIMTLSAPADQSIAAWVINELKNYVSIALIILALIATLEILKRIGLIEKLNKLLEPILNFIGMTSKIVPLTIIGLTLGLAYGGALIIDETRATSISKKDIFYSLLLMSLFHSIIEDTMLVASAGGNWSGIILFRFIFAFITTAILIRITRNWDDTKMDKYFTRKNFSKQ
ncbi:MAG: hypothetical protein IKJ67_00020 [Bacteroidales bacterium]|nr:hypothetical protein [Bacteroidales bacterium]